MLSISKSYPDHSRLFQKKNENKMYSDKLIYIRHLPVKYMCNIKLTHHVQFTACTYTKKEKKCIEKLRCLHLDQL